MKWIPGAGRAEDEQLAADYEKSTVQGKFHLGETYLFRKKALGVWYLAWREILWAYRQVEDVQSRLCCGTTNYEVEHLILVTEGGQTDGHPPGGKTGCRDGSCLACPQEPGCGYRVFS